MSEKKKRNDMSITEKLSVLDKYEELSLSCISQREAAKMLGVPQSTLSKWLKSKNDFKVKEVNESRKRKRDGKSQSVEEALLMWFKEASTNNSPINRRILLQKANQLGEELNEEFTATDGWLTRWKTRHGIVYRNPHRDKSNSNELIAINWLRTDWQEDVLNVYSPDNIFIAGETGLYYKATPDLCPSLKNVLTLSGKKIDDRITLFFACNMTGTVKVKPLVIGKTKFPPCFRGVKNLPVEYVSNENAWMTNLIFEEFVNNWDKQLGEEGRSIALVLDSCPAHPNINLRNIRLVFVPLNAKSLAQPLNQGIIKDFKTFYRLELRNAHIRSVEHFNPAFSSLDKSSDLIKNMSILDALHAILNAWNKIPGNSIAECFKKSGLNCWDNGEGQWQDSEFVVPPDEMTESVFREWINVDRDLKVSAAVTDKDVVKSEKVGDDEEDVCVRIAVTKKQTRESIGVLRRALEESGASEYDYTLLYNIEDTLDRLYSENFKLLNDR